MNRGRRSMEVWGQGEKRVENGHIEVRTFWLDSSYVVLRVRSCVGYCICTPWQICRRIPCRLGILDAKMLMLRRLTCQWPCARKFPTRRMCVYQLCVPTEFDRLAYLQEEAVLKPAMMPQMVIFA